MDRSDDKKTEQNSVVERGSSERIADPEVSAKAKRRQFTTEYKLRILKEADSCTPNSGELGALLRREGLYASSLQTWRRQRDEGVLEGLKPKKRGRKETKNPLEARVAELEKENDRLQLQLKKAETIIDVQKKVSELLGLSLKDPNSGKS